MRAAPLALCVVLRVACACAFHPYSSSPRACRGMAMPPLPGTRRTWHAPGRSWRCCGSASSSILSTGAAFQAHGLTQLHIAVRNGDGDVAQRLVSQGEDVDATTASLSTPLHIAVEERQIAIARMLLQSGASTDATNDHGCTPLHLAAATGSPELVFSLLAHGAPVHAVCSRGRTPLDVAILQGAPAACLEALLYKDDAVTARSQTLVDMLIAYRASADARFAKTALDQRAGSTLEEREAAYESALIALKAHDDGEHRVMPAALREAALLRLGVVQARIAAEDSSESKHKADQETLRQLWRLQAPQQDGERFVASKMSLARARKTVRLTDEGPVWGLQDICVDMGQPDALDRAVRLWREQGVVVFPGLLDANVIKLLRDHVLAVCERDEENDPLDLTSDIRKPAKRTLRVLPVGERPEALEAIAKELSPFLNEALEHSRHLVLEQAAYRIRPGAAEQTWHVDDSEGASCMTLQVSLVDTAAAQGSFQVRPSTHHYSTFEAFLMWAFPGPPHPAEVSIAVPAGSVMCYSPHVVHRGGANTHSQDRLVIALTLMAAHGRAPEGIPLAIRKEDQGKWWMQGGAVTGPVTGRIPENLHVKCGQ